MDNYTSGKSTVRRYFLIEMMDIIAVGNINNCHDTMIWHISDQGTWTRGGDGCLSKYLFKYSLNKTSNYPNDRVTNHLHFCINLADLLNVFIRQVHSRLASSFYAIKTRGNCTKSVLNSVCLSTWLLFLYRGVDHRYFLYPLCWWSWLAS